MQKLWLHISIIVLTAAFTATAYSQKIAIPTNYKGIKDAFPNKAINDTLNNVFDTTVATLYASPNGGFVSGNSSYGESQKAQFFDASLSKPYTLYGFIYWFGYKKQRSLDSDSSLVELLFYKLDGTITVNNVSYLIPKTLVDSTGLLVKNIDTSATYTSGANVWMLDSTQAVTYPFAGAISFKGLNSLDTIALYSSTDGDVTADRKSWEKWNNNWYSIFANWGLKTDFAIFPLVEIPDSLVSLEDVNVPVQMQVFPNPANEQLTINLNSAYQGEVDLIIMDMNGRVIMQEKRGEFVGTQQNIAISTASFTSGTYILSIGIDKKYRATKKIVIAH